MLFEEALDMQATMFQPVGGMDRIPYHLRSRVGKHRSLQLTYQQIRKTANGVKLIYRDGESGPVRSIEAALLRLRSPLRFSKPYPMILRK